MGYLLPSEYVEYGLTAETSDDWVTMASTMIEAYCRRPSLLVTQYVERMRLTAGAQTVRLSYRPLAAAVGALRRWWGCGCGMVGLGAGSCLIRFASRLRGLSVCRGAGARWMFRRWM